MTTYVSLFQQTVLCFICVSEMSSDDEEVTSPVLGAQSSKDHALVTPLEPDSEFDDYAKKKTLKYKRPRVEWKRVLAFTKGADAVADEDEIKSQTAQGASAFMQAAANS